ncbi:hypothetical protein HN385_04600 [archaeon]|mgnify:CR=1 FL=1|jgi:hypothetical protein|nr:hypothetical protein [archaeon]MBT3450430.1 hypothetical protein [archaeon]MBT6869173.1 hypothetical protein [archaeon]MBT7192820.1 hypothetical protein [archaeon]MBT7381360.1 hypothetical protein [archaeon]
MALEVQIFKIENRRVIKSTIFGDDIIGRSNLNQGYQVRLIRITPEEPVMFQTDLQDTNELCKMIQSYKSTYKAYVAYFLPEKTLSELSPKFTEQEIN